MESNFSPLLIFFLLFFNWIYCLYLFQLAISPQPHNAVDPVSVQLDTHLALKVEGVIQHGNQPNLYRRAQAVSVNVISVLHSHSHTTAAVMAASGIKVRGILRARLKQLGGPRLENIWGPFYPGFCYSYSFHLLSPLSHHLFIFAKTYV